MPVEVNGVRPVFWAKEHYIFVIKVYKKGFSGFNTPPFSFTFGPILSPKNLGIQLIRGPRRRNRWRGGILLRFFKVWHIYTIQVEIHSLAEKGDRIKTILLFVLIAGIAFLQYATEFSLHRQPLLYQGGLPIITLKEWPWSSTVFGCWMAKKMMPH